MYLLRRLLEVSSKNSAENGSLDAPSPYGLPTELIAQIIANLSDPRDLARVCRVSKLFKVISESLLYVRIEINPKAGTYSGVHLDNRQLLPLRKALLVSNHALLVKDLRINMYSWQLLCPKIDKYARSSDLLRRCRCTAYDKVIGGILELLHSLRTLHLHCDLCLCSTKDRHGYLSRLKLPYLTAFRFACYCSSDTICGVQLIEAIPYLRTVTAFSMDWRYGWIMTSGVSKRSHMIKAGVLPNITALIHNGTAVADSIVRARPISRLSLMKRNLPLTGHPSNLHLAITESPGKLTHLYADDLLEGLVEYLRQSPQPYRDLTSVGTLLFRSYKYAEVLHDLSPLTVLQRLESIEVDRGMLSKPAGGSFVCSKPEFRSALTDRHPALRSIFISTRQTVAGGHLVGTEVWKRAPLEWIYQKMPYFSYWDVLNGAYDNPCESLTGYIDTC